MRRLIIVSALLALVATACRIETNIGATINADGSGTIVAELGMDEEAEGFFLQDGTDPFADQALSSVPGAVQREETRGDLRVFIIEVPVADVSTLQDQMIAGSDSLLSNFTVTVTDTKVSVSATADPTESIGSQAEGFDPTVFEESFSANVRLTLPGRVLSHNADRVEGNTLIWEIPVLGGALDIQAESDPTGTPAGDGGGFPLWILAVAAAVAIAIVVYVMMQRKKPSAAVAADGSTPPPPVAADGSTPPPPMAE